MSRLITAMRAAQILRDARDCISTPYRWVKRSFGMGADGQSMDSLLQRADRVCSLGALGKVAGLNVWGEKRTPELRIAVRLLRESIAFHSEMTGDERDIIRFNDRIATTHEDVLAAFDLAIEQACKAVRKEANDTKDQAE